MPPNTRLVTECLSLLSLNLFSRLKRCRGAYLSFLSQSAFFFATTRHGWKALTAQQQQIHRVLCQDFAVKDFVVRFCGQDFVVRRDVYRDRDGAGMKILWSDGTFTVIGMVQGWAGRLPKELSAFMEVEYARRVPTEAD
jgi:hypothetical protein